MSETSITANELAVLRNELRARHFALRVAIHETVGAGTCRNDIGRLRAQLTLAIHRRRTCIVGLVSPVLAGSKRSVDLAESQQLRDRLQSIALPALGLWTTEHALRDRAGYADIVDDLAGQIAQLADQETATLDRALAALEESASRQAVSSDTPDEHWPMSSVARCEAVRTGRAG